MRPRSAANVDELVAGNIRLPSWAGSSQAAKTVLAECGRSRMATACTCAPTAASASAAQYQP